MNNTTNSPTPNTLASAVLFMLLAVTAWAQVPPAEDLETAATLHERASWPTSGTLRGVEFPSGEALLELAGIDLIEGQQTLSGERFAEVAGGLSFVRTITIAATDTRMLGLRTLLRLEVIVAESDRQAQDAMLGFVARTHSIVAAPGADPASLAQREWTRRPFDETASDDARLWSDLGDVRIGLRVADGAVGSVVFTRGNVQVRIHAEAAHIPNLLSLAASVDGLIQRSPQRARGQGGVVAIELPAELAWRATAPVAVQRDGGGELVIDFAVTGGMVTIDPRGEQVYYAGDLGTQTIRVRAADAYGFPSSAEASCNVVAP